MTSVSDLRSTPAKINFIVAKKDTSMCCTHFGEAMLFFCSICLFLYFLNFVCLYIFILTTLHRVHCGVRWAGEEEKCYRTLYSLLNVKHLYIPHLLIQTVIQLESFHERHQGKQLQDKNSLEIFALDCKLFTVLRPTISKLGALYPWMMSVIKTVSILVVF